MSAIEVADILESMNHTYSGTNWENSNDVGGKQHAKGLLSFQKIFQQIGTDFRLIKFDNIDNRSSLPFEKNVIGSRLPQALTYYITMGVTLLLTSENIT